MKPPYHINAAILQLVVSISEKIGAVNAAYLYKPPAELRKKNRIKTIQSSLGIEGNTLNIEQVTALFENKRVLGPEKEIIEVKNAIAVYERLDKLSAFKLSSFLKAHGLLMKGLIDRPGSLRSKAVGIVKGARLAHLAPPGAQVKPLLNNLFSYLNKDPDPILIKSCVFHYELEFIHPFLDGNGRMGRLWQTLILMKEYAVFEFLPLETLIKKKQAEYYKALALSDKAGHSTPFIEFMLRIIHETLNELLKGQNIHLDTDNRIGLAREFFGKRKFSRKDYLHHFKNISTATASRDLKKAVDQGMVRKSGEKNATVYQFL